MAIKLLLYFEPNSSTLITHRVCPVRLCHNRQLVLAARTSVCLCDLRSIQATTDRLLYGSYVATEYEMARLPQEPTVEEFLLYL